MQFHLNDGLTADTIYTYLTQLFRCSFAAHAQ